MEAFTSPTLIKPFTSSELGVLNRCRLYLQATNLSDLTDGSGHRIAKHIRDGYRDKYRPQYHIWSVQQSPSVTQWRLWRKALKICFPTNDDKTLLSPKGAWTDDYKEKWQWFLHSPTARVYQRRGPTWKVYKKYFSQSRIKKGMLFSYETQALALPPQAQRVTVRRRNNKIRIQGWAPEQASNIPFSLISHSVDGMQYI